MCVMCDVCVWVWVWVFMNVNHHWLTTSLLPPPFFPQFPFPFLFLFPFPFPFPHLSPFVIINRIIHGSGPKSSSQGVRGAAEGRGKGGKEESA
ncbi:hypothetical protein GGR50DRAFT_224262 [Xylaria sp. CBS 124048]|nr:hypothetical protein GGR50DRAFT_224262 [Xylaria sp. CBS 124048]